MYVATGMEQRRPAADIEGIQKISMTHPPTIYCKQIFGMRRSSCLSDVIDCRVRFCSALTVTSPDAAWIKCRASDRNHAAVGVNCNDTYVRVLLDLVDGRILSHKSRTLRPSAYRAVDLIAGSDAPGVFDALGSTNTSQVT